MDFPHRFGVLNYLIGWESGAYPDRQTTLLFDLLSLIPGGTPHMKGVGMLVGNFALNP